jgi:hypothetical protein
MSTHMWRTEPGVVRIQTDCPKRARMLSRRSRPQLVGWSVRQGKDKYIRIFELRDIRPQNALRTFSYILGRKPKWNPVNEEWE